jgi:flagellar P-ring protein precursor FlgI
MSSQVAAVSRIKDVVSVEGIRENPLIGYGLVVGLNGTGDKIKNNKFTEQSLISFLERLGVNTRDSQLKSKNVAAVTVTASLPPFARNGSRLDVNVSAMGDAKSLLGGTLLATPLYGADGEVYAVAQGKLAVGGFSAGGDAQSVTKGVPTNAAVVNGAIVEREIAFALNDMQSVKLALNNPDLTTAERISKTINASLGGISEVMDPGTVQVTIPRGAGSAATVLAKLEQLTVSPDQAAKIIIDESSGTIVMGDDVRIDTVAIAQGNLVIRVNESALVSQPEPFAPESAATVAVPKTDITVDEGAGNRMAIVEQAATLRELVGGLNALGVGPRDLISILQAIKASGALQADIQTM